MATKTEQDILRKLDIVMRGLNIVMRTTFAPNEPTAQAKHFASLQQDIGPWFISYADEIQKEDSNGQDTTA